MDTTVHDVPNSRAIAKQLLTLAKDPENQPFIVQEAGCLSGLVAYTTHEDVDVVLIATRAIQFLSSHPANKQAMRDFPDLVHNMVTALGRAKESPKIKDFVKGALENLQVSVNVALYESEEEDEAAANDENAPGAANTAQRRASLGGSKKSAAAASAPAAPAAPAAPKPELGEFRTVTLLVPGADKRRAAAESAVIQVDGVISVTVHVDRQHVLVGTRVHGDAFTASLLADLAEAGFNGARVVVPPAKRAPAAGEEDAPVASDDAPDYIDEDAYDYDDDDVAQGSRLTRQGFSSLEQRLEQQRQEEEAKKQEKGSRLIGKMNSLLSNASSWLLGY